METYNFIYNLPVLPLRGIVVFPKTMLHFDVGRQQSQKAINIAMKNDQLIFLVAQKNPAVHIFYAKNHLGMTDKVEADFNPESLQKAKELLEGVESVID